MTRWASSAPSREYPLGVAKLLVKELRMAYCSAISGKLHPFLHLYSRVCRYAMLTTLSRPSEARNTCGVSHDRLGNLTRSEGDRAADHAPMNAD